jgi:hypothetical protein
VNGSFAALLAGLASRRAEKKAQVIEAKDVKAIEDAGTKYSKCCATNVDNQQIASQKNGLGRKRRIKTRKPRAESLAKWPTHDTPPPTPPATDSHA